MKKTVLVTGANGFTGSNLCRELLKQGYHVRAMVRPSSNLKALNGIEVEIVHGDLAVDDVINPKALIDVDVIYNIAALYRQEGATYDVFLNVNANGVDRLLKASMDAGVSRFVHCSTGGVHGHIKNPPADENAPYNPGDWYQASKLEGEKRVLDFGRKYGYPVSVIRPSPIYGAGDMRFLKLFRAINNRTFWMIGSGKPLYHFVYVDDLITGIILAGERFEAIGEVFILAGSECVTISKLVELIAEELGRPVPRRKIPLGPVMFAAKICKAVCLPLRINPPLYPRRLDFFIKDRAFDTTKARRVLGYSPKIDLRTGIAQTAAWYREHNYI
jgi:nucleoside-diphosphate-sugar epimerase